MDESIGKLTVFFEDPFWVGVFERIEDGRLSVCKVTFGAEPKDCEVWDFVLKHYGRLRFSPAVDVVAKRETAGPKRVQRELRRHSGSTGVGTKSQEALRLQREAGKLAKQTASREQREAERQRRYDLKQQKRKEKHRGR